MTSPISFLMERFALAGDREAIIWKEKTFSFQWLHSQVDHWETQLDSWGVKQGQIVVLEADFSPNSLALFLALTSRRAILVPLTESVSHKKIEFTKISQGEVRICINSDDKVSYENLTNQSNHKLYDLLRDRKSPGLVLFSSGSTGASKAALHDLSSVLDKYKVERPSRRTMSFLLYDHIGGLNTMLHTISNQACLVTVQQRDPDYVMKAISEYQAQVLPASPTFLNLILLNKSWKRYDLSCLELVTYGTEPMPESTLKRFHSALPHVKLLQTYGLSEVGILRSKSRSDDSLWVRIGGEGFQTRIVDGLLEIQAQSAMLGYLNAPSPFTADGWFQTGDEVEVDGEWIKIMGRRSEIINVGGEKVYPAVVEGVIQELDGVIDVAVRGEVNSITGMIVTAKVHLNTTENSREFKKRMREFCTGKLQPFQIPVKTEITQENLHGKRFKKMRKS